MTFIYEKNPTLIEKKSFVEIRELSDLSPFDKEQQQVVMRIIHSLGLPHLASQVRFSKNACASGMQALSENCTILCDVEMVKQGITKRMINKEPLCFLNDLSAVQRAKETGETRSMAAVAQWQNHLAGSIIIIGNAPTALFRLLENLKTLHKDPKLLPALVIGMPVGFVGAAESKQALWDYHESLGIECITLLGREGGSAVSAASCNALLRCNRGEYY